jgi:hypothetical protein
METVYAYLAGIIDVDGYIFIGRRIKHPRGNSQPDSYSYIPTIGISSTSLVVPDLFQETFPARRREFHPKDTKFTGWHWWEAAHEAARRPLISLAPFLRIKHRQAELVLLLLDLIADHNALRPRNQALTPEQQSARQRLYEEVELLNGPRSRVKYRQRNAPQRSPETREEVT